MSKINFKDKHMRYGGYGALLTLLIIAITITANIFITNLNIKIDTTSEKLYSLSDSSKEVVSKIDQPINMYVLEETGSETPLLKEVLTNYTKLNDKLSLIYKDPTLYPTFGSSYLERSTQNLSSLKNSTVIVENTTTGKFKIVPPSEFIAQGGENSNNQITLENAITNALGYVLTDNDGAIYYTTGHNEVEISTTLKDCFDHANLTSKSINLLTENTPDPETSALLINSPHSDFTDAEVTKIIDYLSQGGKAMIFLDADTPNLEKFNAVLNYYGMNHQTGIAIETTSSNMSSASPAYLIPTRGEHEIIDNISSNSAPIIIPAASALTKANQSRDTLKITPLLTTSDGAFLKKDIGSSTLTKEAGDVNGPFVIAAAIEDSIDSPSGKTVTPKLFVMANSYFLTNNFLNVSATGNINFMNSTLGWLLSLDTNYAIESKTQDIYQIRALTSTETVLIEVLTMVIIPLIVIITGITVWVKRRHL